MSGPGAGGGGSGAVWEEDFKITYIDLLSHSNADAYDYSLVQAVNNALSSSGNPYSGESYHDPSDRIDNMDIGVAEYRQFVDSSILESVLSRIRSQVATDLAAITYNTTPELRNAIGDIVDRVLVNSIGGLLSHNNLLVSDAFNTAKTVKAHIVDDIDTFNNTLRNIAVENGIQDIELLNEKASTLTLNILNDIINKSSSAEGMSDRLFSLAQSASLMLTDEQLSMVKTTIENIVTDMTGVSAHGTSLFSTMKTAANVDGAADFETAFTIAMNKLLILDQLSSNSRQELSSTLVSEGKSGASDVVTDIDSDATTRAATNLAASISFADSNIVDLIRTSFTNLLPIIGNIINDGLTAASAVFSSTAIKSARDNFENRKIGSHLRSVSRYASGMAALNAVQHSTFIIGLALMENDFNAQVDSFEQEISTQLFSEAFRAYISMCQQTSQSHIASYLNFFQAYLTEKRQTYGEQEKLFSEYFSLNMQAALNALNTYIQGFNSNASLLFNRIDASVNGQGAVGKSLMDIKSTLLQNMTQISASNYANNLNTVASRQDILANAILKGKVDGLSMFGQRLDGENQLVRTDLSALSTYYLDTLTKNSELMKFLQAAVLATIDGETKRGLGLDEFGLRHKQVATETALNTINSGNSARKDLLHYTLEANRMAIVADSEAANANLDIDVGFSRWDLEVFQYAENVLAAGFGGVVTPPQASTKRQSALSNALGGASMGNAVLPGWGAAIGAAIGYLGSYL